MNEHIQREVEMSFAPLEGGCFCRAVRYTLTAAALSVQHCHCETCRKLSASLSHPGAVCPREAITIHGQESLKQIRTSPSFERHFCSGCGCHLFGYEESEPRLMYFLPATLDGGAHPGHPADKESHIYVRSKAPWERMADSLPQYLTTSPDEIITEQQKAEILNY